MPANIARHTSDSFHLQAVLKELVIPGNIDLQQYWDPPLLLLSKSEVFRQPWLNPLYLE